MYGYLIYSRLKKAAHTVKNFHIPGHKCKGEFKSMFKGADLDVTELPYSDNLLNPKGVIAKAQNEIAEILGATKSYITCDGSTSGIYAMLYAASKRGNKVIVMRNSHASVFNACRLFGLEPLIVQGAYEDGILYPPECDIIEKLVAGDNNISAFLVTSPDYYGNIANLEGYLEILKKYGRLLLVDEAHGAHLAFGDKKGYAGLYADMWVDGAHKTLPALTQGAIVNINNEQLIPDAEEALSLFRSTSPSYPVMASVEYGVKCLENNPKYIQRAKLAVKMFTESCNGVLPVKILGDWTKILVDFKPLKISPDLVLQRLEKKGIYAEFSDGRFILFYISPMVTEADLLSLRKKLASIVSNKKIQNTFTDKPPIPEGDRSYSFQYALRKPTEYIPLEEAEGRMCARTVGLNPPCIPVVVTGEIISAAAIKTLSSAKATFGLTDGNICVVKKA